MMYTTPMSALDMNDYRGSGSCTVLITVAAANLLRDIPDQEKPRYQRLEWRVVVGEEPDEEPVWVSNGSTRLTVNSQGIAIGSAQVSVRELLRALVKAIPPEWTLQDILDRITPDWLEENPDEAAKVYRNFGLRVLIGNQFIRLPIDMGVTGDGRRPPSP